MFRRHTGVRPPWFGPKAKYVAAVGFLGLFFCAGCTEPTPSYFERGDRVYMGDWMIRVSHVESLSPSVVGGFGEFRLDGDDATLLAIHLTLDHQGEAGTIYDLAEGKFIKLIGVFRLRDETGAEYKLGLPIQEHHFRWMRSSANPTAADLDMMMQSMNAANTRDWVLLFVVPDDARGFSLRFKANKPREGQPKLASVSLGR